MLGSAERSCEFKGQTPRMPSHLSGSTFNSKPWVKAQATVIAWKLDRRGEGIKGTAEWDLDELALNESISRAWRVPLVLGTWGGEQLLRKGGISGAN